VFFVAFIVGKKCVLGLWGVGWGVGAGGGVRGGNSHWSGMSRSTTITPVCVRVCVCVCVCMCMYVFVSGCECW